VTKESKSSAIEDGKDENKGAETGADDMDVDSEPASESGKKRQAKEEIDSDDEPPTKRQRRKPAKSESATTKAAKPVPKKAAKSPSKAKKAAPKKEATEAAEEDDEDPVPTPKSRKEKPKARVTEVEEQEEAGDEPAPPAKVKKTGKKTKTADVDEDEDGEKPIPKKGAKGKKKDIKKSPSPAVSAKEKEGKDEEELLSSDEEPPEIKAKVREKVQSTFNVKTKDPYPDWKAGEPVPYAALCTTFSKIEMTTKRLEIMAHCSLFLRQVLRLTPSDLLPTILLMVNKLAADYAGIELGIGESLIMKAVSESTGRSLQHIKADQNETGDLGLVAAKSRSKQPTMFKPKALTIQGVHKGFLAIAEIEGHGSQGRKVDCIKKLLSAADAHSAGKAFDITKDNGGPSESKFIVRTLEGKLRLGLAEKTVIVALAHAMTFHEFSQKGDKTPTTSDIAKAEATLKAVYR